VETQQTEAFLSTAEICPDLILADPPRAGLGKTVVSRLLKLRPAALILVACDPATLARDLAGLAPAYAIDRLMIVDLFPQTFHLETIASLTLR
jgi:23S rRNA (uracil1939-C5)-methyltransferase